MFGIQYKKILHLHFSSWFFDLNKRWQPCPLRWNQVPYPVPSNLKLYPCRPSIPKGPRISTSVALKLKLVMLCQTTLSWHVCSMACSRGSPLNRSWSFLKALSMAGVNWRSFSKPNSSRITQKLPRQLSWLKIKRTERTLRLHQKIAKSCSSLPKQLYQGNTSANILLQFRGTTPRTDGGSGVLHVEVAIVVRRASWIDTGKRSELESCFPMPTRMSPWPLLLVRRRPRLFQPSGLFSKLGPLP